MKRLKWIKSKQDRQRELYQKRKKRYIEDSVSEEEMGYDTDADEYDEYEETEYDEEEAEYEDEEYEDDAEYEEEDAEYQQDLETCGDGEESDSYETEEEYDEETEYDSEEYDETEYDGEPYEESEYEDDDEYDEDEDAEYQQDLEACEDETEYDSEEYDEETEYDSEEYDEAEYEDDEYEETDTYGKHRGEKGNIRRISAEKRGKRGSKGNSKRNVRKSHEKRKSGKGFNLEALKKVPLIDWIVGGTGVAVLIIAIVTMSLISNAREEARQVSGMVTLGEELSSIEMIGQSGLLAVADARANVVPVTEEESTREEETEEDNKSIEVVVNMTSVERDLKVKFVNKATNKLISGTEFQMEQTGPDNKVKTLTDDDKDGVIYQSGIAAGTYSIKLISVDDFVFPDKASKVTVKDKIEYKKIDVTDEIKTEKEVNAAKEDTQQKVQVESKLADTVEFVESTKTPISGGSSNGDYKKIDKSTIEDPGKSAKAKSAESLETRTAEGYSFFLTAPEEGDGTGEGTGDGDAAAAVTGVSLSSSSMNLKVGDSGSLSATVSPDNASNKNVSFSSDNTGVATVSGSGSVSAVSAGTATITVTTEDGGKTASCTVTVEAQAPVNIAVTGITLNKSDITLKTGGTEKLSATVSPADAANKNVTYASGNTAIATVAADGTVTGAAAGSTTITAKTEDGGHTASCTVKVEATTKPVTGVSLDKTTLALTIGQTGKLTPTVAPAEASNKNVTYTSSNTAIATVAADGTVKGIAAGKAAITVKTEDGGKTAACEVTVSKAKLELKLDNTSVSIYKGATIELKPTPVGFSATPAYAFWSGNEKIAKISSKGIITGVAKGKTKVAVKATLGSESVTAECEVLVKLKTEDDKSTKLKDKSGNQVYVKENGSYREATAADYYTFNEFYIGTAVSYKYTGWQTIDNVTYYFDKNGNKVTGTQVIQGVQYTFDGNGALSAGNGTMGIDVSKWNGTINWEAVKNSGVSFAIIRCGYRGSSTGALIQDPKFAANIKGAQAAGIKVGVYFFTQAVNEVEAVEEASMVLNLINGIGLSMPVYIDTEGSGGRADGIDRNTRTAVCKAFCATIQNAGRTAGVYASKSWFEGKLNAGSLNSYKIWLAQYATKPTYSGKYDMWQYTSKGSVGGISGNVDLNILR